MASRNASLLVVTIDRWFVLGTLGLIGMIVSAVGEVLGWWHDLGEWGLAFSIAAFVLGYLLNATRGQATGIHRGVLRVEENTHRIEENTERIEENTERIEQNTERIEQNTQAIPRLEASSERIEQGIARLDDHGRETVTLLREIRDRLPERPA